LDHSLALPPVDLPVARVVRPATPDAPFPWRYEHEQHWLADEIMRDMAELTLYGLAPKAGPKEYAAMDLTVSVAGRGQAWLVKVAHPRGDVSLTLPQGEHFWAPETFAVWAKVLQQTWKAPPALRKVAVPPPQKAATLEEDALAARLTQPTARVLVAEGKRISAALSKAPWNAALHEEAALVVGAHALREAAGPFTDIRPALCRMTAHLALAQSLAGEREAPAPATVTGRLAKAVLATLCARQMEAMGLLAELNAPADSPLAAWVTALQMRNTGDWRLLHVPEAATLLEQLAYARALVSSRDAGALVEALDKVSDPSLPDWSRLGTARAFTLAEGQVLMTDWLERETGDLAASWQEWAGEALPQDGLVPLLNTPASRAVVLPPDREKGKGPVRLEVLGWGSLAAAHQRQLCQSISQTRRFLPLQWGVADAAVGFTEQAMQAFAGLRLLPFVELHVAESVISERVLPPLTTLCLTRPELVSAGNWAALTRGVSENAPAVASALPPPGVWFNPPLVPGTAWDFALRQRSFRTVEQADVRHLASLLALAPWDFDLQLAHLHRRHGLRPSHAQLQEAFSLIESYHLPAMELMAEELKSDPGAYLEHMTRVCPLAPDHYIGLGTYLVEQDMVEEAAFAYQAAHELARDRVAWAERAGWLADYYLERGQGEAALRMARALADVPSPRGLEVLARVTEHLGRWQEALQSYDQLASRFQETEARLAFCYRQRDSHPAVAQAFSAELPGIFPHGLQPAEALAASLGATPDRPDPIPPAAGVEFASDSLPLQQAGLEAGQVVVACDGWQVHTVAQLDFILLLQPGEPMVLIVWTGTDYREVTVHLPDRDFGAEMADYTR
jgi:tetratricopeptide (TPR) repeat protein